MSYLKPHVRHPSLRVNKIGLTRRDYEGALSTLCAGCGHDSVSASIIEAVSELSIPPHRVAKLSGIGCSSKTPTYFLGKSHGFNSVHGRMPSVATGANCANRDLLYIGVSGDGDSASIGLGQFAHVIRRGLNMVYIVDNNGTYGLTKGQFSATTDVGSKNKVGVQNTFGPIDLVSLAMQIGATFVARSFSGDKAQLVPLLKAAISHRGFAFVDVISPCVAFANHEGSTKSYANVRQKSEEVISVADFVPSRKQLTTSYDPGDTQEITLHDGSRINLRKLDHHYDASDRVAALNYVQSRQAKGEIVTGLLYLDPDAKQIEFHQKMNTIDDPLASLTQEKICPGDKVLQNINDEFR